CSKSPLQREADVQPLPPEPRAVREAVRLARQASGGGPAAARPYAVPMRAMLFEGVGTPLREAELEEPVPGPGQVRLRVRGCGVCRTDLHIVDGELAEPK